VSTTSRSISTASCCSELRVAGTTIQHFQPGQPQQSAYIERDKRVRHWALTNGTFNGSLRHEYLDQNIIDTIEEVQDNATRSQWTYNNHRPNIGVGGITQK
jgi:putative transposase